MSDTPRTDAHTRQLIDILQHPHWIDFARSLERENAALRADKERLDWLQKTDWSQVCKGDAWTLYVLIQQRHYAGNNYPSARAAIDAARKEQP